MALPVIYDVCSPEVNRIFYVLSTYGPAAAWTALYATGVDSFPASVADIVRRRLEAPLHTTIASGAAPYRHTVP